VELAAVLFPPLFFVAAKIDRRDLKRMKKINYEQ
jgi:hypothetical protein